jgi:ABC-type antimicrobial peptide transport system permease subunit
MTISLLLIIYVYNEYSFDRNNRFADRIFLTFKNQPVNDIIRTKYITPAPLAAAYRKDFPDIETVARTSESKGMLVANGTRRVKTLSIYADPAWLDMFTVHFVAGSKKNALNGHSIILSESSARALFGKVEAIGKVVKFNNDVDVIVTGVIRDFPEQSSFPVGAIVSWETLTYEQPWIIDAGWGDYNFLTWVLLKKNTSIEAINSKIKHLVGKYFPQDKNITLFLHPLEKYHLYNEFKNGFPSGGRIEQVKLFLILAIGILIIACINFMNLATARSAKRSKEVGVKKTMGAERHLLIIQFLTESLVMSVCAFLIAIGLLFVVTPALNEITGLRLTIPYTSTWFWLPGLCLAILTGIVAGSYPAFVFSAFNPIRLLKGQSLPAGNSARLRQVLVVTQFTFATALIIASFFIYSQVNFIKEREVGYDLGGLIELPAEGDIINSFELFRKEAIENGAAFDASMTSITITSNSASSWDVRWPGQVAGEEKIPIDCIGTTYHFTNTYGLKIIDGRDFDPGHPADTSGVLLNEAAVQLMHLKNPVGQTITWMDSKRTITGVVKNFVWGSPFENVKPAIIGFVPSWQYNIGIRLNPNKPVDKNIATLEQIYKRLNPQYPFDFTFTDENFARKYSNQKLTGQISLGFTVLAILIAGLGLFGLASFAVEQRRKELGIRRVLGASVLNLWMNLSRQFIALVMVAFLIGSAVSWYFICQWLNTFTFHIGFSVGVFVVTLFISLFICFAAVSGQAIRAAAAKPVKFLREE